MMYRWARVIGIMAAMMVIGCGGSEPVTRNSEEQKPRVAYVTNGIADFWTIADAGAKKGAEEFGADLQVLMPANGIGDQKQQIEDLLSQGIDGLAVSPIDPVNQTELLNEVAENTILITHDSDAPESNRQVYIGMDNYLAGRMCGELVEEALPEGGEVMILIGRMEQDNARRRRQGVIDQLMGRPVNADNFDAPGKVIRNDKYVILDTLTDQFDRAKAKANAEDTLSRYPDVACMVGLFTYNPPLCLEALQQAGKLGQVKVVAFDEAEETLQGITDGSVYGTVVQNPFEYGRQSVRVLVELVEGNNGIIPENLFIDIPARQIRQDNVATYWSELNEKLGRK